MFQVHCLLTACTIHIINIPSISATSYLSVACNIFQDLTGVNEWAKSSLGILRGLSRSWNLILPTEVEEAMNRNSDDPESSTRSQRSATGSMGQASPNHSMPTDPAHAYRSLSMSANYFAQQEHLQQQQATQQQQMPPQSQGGDANDAAPTKRPSGPNVPQAPPKRQRISLDQTGKPMNLNSQIPQTAQNFLYSPLDGQSAPLLIPGRSNVLTNVPQHAAPPTASGAPEPGKAAPTAQMTSTTSSATGTPVKVEGEAPNQGQPKPQPQGPAQAQQSRQQQPQPGQQDQQTAQQQQKGAGDVDGLTFEDDWRDPFMGYLGQTE